MDNYEVAAGLLAEAVAFAMSCEQAILRAHQTKPPGTVAYMTLIAERRFGQAVAALGKSGAYESRVLIRSMFEHYFNLVWILMRAPHRRANRFLKFLPLDRLRVIDSLPATEKREHMATIAKLRARRTKYRALFRVTDKKTGRRRWSKSWAEASTLEARVVAVSAMETKESDPTKPFMYTMYRWFSASAHGSPLHFHPLVKATRYGGRPTEQPESHPEAVVAGAAVLVIGTIRQASRVLSFSNSRKEELFGLEQRVAAFTARYAAT